MENNQNIDQIIRQKFEGFEPVPPESVWLNVKARISPPPASPPSITGIILSILTGIAIMMAIITLVLNLRTIPAAEATASSSLPQMTMPSTNDGPHASATPATEIKTSNAPIPVRVPPQEIEQNAVEKKSAIYSSENSTNLEASSSAAILNYKPYAGDYRLSLNKYNTHGIDFTKNTNLAPKIDFGKLNLTDPEYAHSRDSHWSISVLFNPEITTYNTDSISDNRSYAFQVAPSLHFGNFFIQSGVGFRFATDEGNLAVNYQKYLGSYQHVYLVTFDSTAQGIIPTYYTNTVDVYDTIDRYAISGTKVHYTYLDIPLFLGYCKSFNKISLYAQGGLNMSFLVNKYVPVADSPEEHARIMNVDQQIPTRANFNWQLMAAAGISYNLSEQFGVMIEPTFRYYLNSEYNQPGQQIKHPFAYGIRAGFIYHFNH